MEICGADVEVSGEVVEFVVGESGVTEIKYVAVIE